MVPSLKTIKNSISIFSILLILFVAFAKHQGREGPSRRQRQPGFANFLEEIAAGQGARSHRTSHLKDYGSHQLRTRDHNQE